MASSGKALSIDGKLCCCLTSSGRVGLRALLVAITDSQVSLKQVSPVEMTVREKGVAFVFVSVISQSFGYGLFSCS